MARSYKQADFPTPHRLITAQLDYLSNVKKTVPKPYKLDGKPNLFPPQTNKKAIFKKKDYQKIDRWASQVSKEVSSRGMESLVTYLISEAHNDIGKVRSFYVWISSQRDEPNYPIIYNAHLDNPYNKVMMAKAMCYDYNKLFCEMCKQAKIPCHIVEGAAKGFHNQDDPAFPLDGHHWSIVFVAGAWRFVDQTFASSIAHRTMGSDSQIVEASTKAIARALRRGTFSDYIHEEHFLTDPELFIYRHFPEDDEMQLLARRVSLEEFSKMAVVTKCYFDWEFDDLSHPKANIVTDDGYVELWFRPKAGQTLLMNFILLKYSDAKKDTKGELSPQYSSYIHDVQLAHVRLENKNGLKIFKIYFRRIGRFKLQVLVPDLDVKSQGVGSSVKWHSLVHYLIQCNCPYFAASRMPVVSTVLPEIGPCVNWQSMKITCNVDGGYIKAEKGFAKFILQHPSDICFNFQLKRHEHEVEFEECILIDTNTKTTTVYIRLPSPGTFLLKGFTGRDCEPSVRHSCNFLIESDLEYPWQLFPLLLQKCIGAVSGSTVLKAECDSYLALGNKEDELVIEMQSTPNTTFLTKLLYFNGRQETLMPEYVWHEHAGDKLVIYCRFKFAGTYILKTFSKCNLNSNSFTPAWKHFIDIDTPTKDCLPFPEKMKDWKENMVIVSPKSRMLRSNQVMPFEIKVPGASAVGLAKVGEGETFDLRKESEGRFLSSINTLSQEGYLVLFVQGMANGGSGEESGEDEEDEIKQLLRYQVVKSANVAKLRTEHQQQLAAAEVRKEEQHQAMLAAKEKAKQYKKEVDQEEARLRSEFESKKKELFAKEAQLDDNTADQQFRANINRLPLTRDVLRDMIEKFTVVSDENIHKVLMAALLLLSVSEAKTGKQDDCKKVLLHWGDKHLMYSMLEIRLYKVHPSVMTRVKHLIKGIDWLKVKEQNPGAGLVSEWVKECAASYRGDLNAVAAESSMQKKLFDEN